MTRGSVVEYAAAVRGRYVGASKRQKGVILDEVCRTTGYHRKAAIRLLRGGGGAARCQGRGRPRRYGLAVVQALARVWEASGRLCGKRLASFLPQFVAALERHGQLGVSAAVRGELVALSAASIDRLLRPVRDGVRRHPFGQRRAAAGVRAQVPIRTFADWQDVSPGAVQADLVLHCGETTEGFSLATLLAVDVATGWTECEAVWGKGQQRVGAAVHHARQRLPFALRELHTDNGAEFLNAVLYRHCQRAAIRCTRGRPYKKNDQAYAEQKNGLVVRRLVGYDRYASRAAYAALQRLYALVRLDTNFFQPLRKLISKQRVGATVTKRYDVAKTPYQRLLASGVLDDAQRQALQTTYERINPVQLRTAIDAALEQLWKLAERERPGYRQAIAAIR